MGQAHEGNRAILGVTGCYGQCLYGFKGTKSETMRTKRRNGGFNAFLMITITILSSFKEFFIIYFNYSLGRWLSSQIWVSSFLCLACNFLAVNQLIQPCLHLSSQIPLFLGFMDVYKLCLSLSLTYNPWAIFITDFRIYCL